MNTPDTRQKIILEDIYAHGFVKVIDVAARLSVSEMTVRRDLDELEKVGLIHRVHGGAISARGRSYEPPLAIRANENVEVKQRLGRYAAEMVAEGNSISLDIGSTIRAIAENLRELGNITVITPSLVIASLFLDRANVRLVLPGGVVRPGETSMIGELAQRNLELLYVDRLFLGVAAIDSQMGLTEYNMEDSQIKQTLIRNAKEVVLVIDSSKFERVAFMHVAPLNALHHCITNEIPSPPLLQALKEANVAIHVVGLDQVDIM